MTTAKRAIETIHLGYEVDTGHPVEIPRLNLAVVGQTQESGKTTTLEALVERSGVTALAFITKRGERSFVSGRRIQPYFRDRADWRFVTSIIDATLQEKNKFLRPWIMKICRTTRTLAEVQVRVREALTTAKGIHEGVYTQLDEYLELIVPEIQRTPLAKTLDLRAGLNVMDVSASPTPMQMLFMQSALDWVNERCDGTIVVVPEAWEFIPEGKGSPVKESAVTLVRKGSGIGNRIWVDSQDMAGVDKVILRGCPVCLIGVQREANEIKRNLSNIPAGIKRPTAAAVAMLERGQFFACWGTHAIKTYVQPAWMTPEEAQAHARGIPVVPSSRASAPPVRVPTPIEEPTVNEREAQKLRDENAILREQVERFRSDEVRRTREGHEGSQNRASLTLAAGTGHDELAGGRQGNPATATVHAFSAGESLDNEATYQRFKKRLLDELPSDPTVLRIITQVPELRVEVERQIITAKGDSLRGRVAQLLVDGFYDGGATAPGTQKELGRRGFDPGPANTYKELDALAVLGFVTIEQGRDDRSRPRKEYHAVRGMKVNIVER